MNPMITLVPRIYGHMYYVQEWISTGPNNLQLCRCYLCNWGIFSYFLYHIPNHIKEEWAPHNQYISGSTYERVQFKENILIMNQTAEGMVVDVEWDELRLLAVRAMEWALQIYVFLSCNSGDPDSLSLRTMTNTTMQLHCGSKKAWIFSSFLLYITLNEL